MMQAGHKSSLKEGGGVLTSLAFKPKYNTLDNLSRLNTKIFTEG